MSQLPGHDIVVIGASAGGVAALQQLVRWLPRELPAAVFVVLHIPAESRSLLVDILGGAGKLPVAFGHDGAKIEHGKIYVAPPDRHLLLTRGVVVRLSRGPKENRHRPALDPLFRSAASAYGPRATGIVLSGTLDDGAAGLRAIKACRGTTMVQDPDEAKHPGMPQNALLNAQIDYCATIEKLASLIIELAANAINNPDDYEVPAHVRIETEFAFMERDMRDMKSLGPPAEFVCPTCHGSLTELHDGEMTRYRCHTGHAFSIESLLADQNQEVESALYAALRAIDENATLSAGSQKPTVSAFRARRKSRRARRNGSINPAQRCASCSSGVAI